jgi:hypothetical protein
MISHVLLISIILPKKQGPECQGKYLLLHDGARALSSVGAGLHGGNLHTSHSLTVRFCAWRQSKNKQTHLSFSRLNKETHLVGDLHILHDGTGDLDGHLLGLHVDLSTPWNTHLEPGCLVGEIKRKSHKMPKT